MIKYKMFFENCKIIEKYYEYLISLTNDHKFVGATNEWIIDNYYIIAEIRVSINKILHENKHIKKELKNLDNLYKDLYNLYDESNYDITYKDILNRLKDYQKDKDKYLTYDAIETVPLLLSFILTDRLTSLCINKKNSQSEKEKIRNLVKSLEIKIRNEEHVKLDDYYY